MLEFNFTRGECDNVEGDANGGFLPNRSYQFDGEATTLQLAILRWENGGTGGSTAADNVFVLDESFAMPQLGRSRRIWLYLPPDYEPSNKRYPVLYMHDAQNLFDEATSFSGEWEVDASLNALHAAGDYGAIVVGINNGGVDRFAEYTPWPHPSLGGGRGMDYLDFIVETLKPYIDQNYRTLTEPEYTAIMGSSLGGLISTYGVIEHQDVFAKAACFSSSYWVSNQAYEHVEQTGRQNDLKIYLIAGQLESTTIDVVGDMYRMEQTLETAGFADDRIFAIDHADGEHNEAYWAREFPAAYQWLFEGLDFPSSLADPVVATPAVTMYPNPGWGPLVVEVSENYRTPVLEVFSADGRQWRSEALTAGSNPVDLGDLPNGVYGISVRTATGVVHREWWVKREE